MPELYLIRHGETDWNRRGLYQGTTDVPLNDEGRRQAEALREALRGVDFDAGYTSPLRRAEETARAVLRGTGVPLSRAPELHEISSGLWQGRAIGPAGRCDPGLEWQWRHSPWSVRFPGGESLDDVRRRAGAVLDAIVAAHDGDVVLVSGHGHVNRVLMIHALGWEPERFHHIHQPNACCWRLEVEHDRRTDKRRGTAELFFAGWTAADEVEAVAGPEAAE